MTYNIIFTGKIAPDQKSTEVKQRLAMLLKADARKIDIFFSGKPILIKKNVDKVTATKYKTAFKSVGAICQVQAVEGSIPTDNINEIKRSDVSQYPDAKIKNEIKTSHFFNTTDGGNMIVTNIESVPGKAIVEHFGLVSGSTIRAKHVGRDIMASLKNLVGGELKGYTELMRDSRKQAMERMIEQARQLGANAVVNARFSTSSVAQGAAELYAYGTAVRIN